MDDLKSNSTKSSYNSSLCTFMDFLYPTNNIIPLHIIQLPQDESEKRPKTIIKNRVNTKEWRFWDDLQYISFYICILRFTTKSSGKIKWMEQRETNLAVIFKT
ncbi:MAG: hypothetical protein DA328_07545 [Nitrososphaeraceae archaeon]|nr:hypothetical protein [Nitrososphaeraceae archaeon]